METSIQTISELYQKKGYLHYDGEGVSQLEHAWQCGNLAKQSGASSQLQLAAWLHDIGHLLSKKEGSPTTYGHDDRHEQTGGNFLANLFSDEVAQPILLHVLAKRYLVATQPEYLETLSLDSIRSLELQGGPLSTAECERFITLPYAQEAIALRGWDDLAKDAQLPTPQPQALIEELVNLAEECA